MALGLIKFKTDISKDHLEFKYITTVSEVAIDLSKWTVFKLSIWPRPNNLKMN